MNESVLNRISISVFANIFRAVIIFITSIVLAKFLGDEIFGYMSFLIGVFFSVQTLLDMGLSSALITLLSQKRRSPKYISLFFSFQFILFLITSALITLVLPDLFLTYIWRSSDRLTIVLCFVAIFLQNGIWTYFLKISESYRLTLSSQFVYFFIVLIHLLLVLIFYKINILEIKTVFISLIFSYLIGLIYMINIFNKNIFLIDNHLHTSNRVIIKDYFNYSKPLIIYTFFSFLFLLSDRWLLQFYSGSKEQAYFSIGLQVSNAVLIITTAFINIFWKEIAEAYHKNDFDLTKNIFKKTTNFIFFISFFIAAFLVQWTDEILLELFGISDKNQSMALCLLFIYPAFAGVCQLCSTFLLAISKPVKVVQINYYFIISSLFVSYFVLAGKDNVIPGLQLGSLGLSAKLLVMNVLQLFAFLFVINKILNQKFDLSTLIKVVLLCFLLSFFSVFVIQLFFSIYFKWIYVFFISGLLYFILALIYSFCFYKSLGFSENFILKLFVKIKKLC
tara:strand:+ start:3736 stop:5253 length:1518 start_codon:yes stop_codon:yes gene_type:complete